MDEKAGRLELKVLRRIFVNPWKIICILSIKNWWFFDIQNSTRMKSLMYYNKVVVIPQVIFKGKRTIPWDEVEQYLLRYVGKIFEVAETEDLIDWLKKNF